MALVLVGKSTSGGYLGSGSAGAAEPAGSQAGDLQIAVCGAFSTQTTTSISGAGWTRLGSILNSTFAGLNCFADIWVRTRPASNDGPFTYTFGSADAYGYGMTVFTYRGHDTTTPVVLAGTSLNSGGNPISITPSASVTADGSQLLAIVCSYNLPGTGITSGGGHTWTQQDGPMAEHRHWTASANTGAIGAITITGDDTDPDAAAVLIINPAASATGAGGTSTGTTTATGTLLGHDVQHSTPAAAAAGTTSVAPAFPATLPAFTKAALAFVQVKPDTVTVTPPSGWTLLTSLAGGGGTFGADAGPTKLHVYQKDTITGSEGGTSATFTVSSATSQVSIAQILPIVSSFPTLDIAYASGTDSTTGTAWSVTTSTDPGVQAGDCLVWANGVPTDVNAGAFWSAHGYSQTGISALSAITEIGESNSSTGNDIGMVLVTAQAKTGTSSAAPVITATAATGTNARGNTILVRIRGVAAAGASGTSTGTTTATGTLSSVGAASGASVGTTSASGTLTDASTSVVATDWYHNTTYRAPLWPNGAPHAFKDNQGAGNWIVPVYASGGGNIAFLRSTDQGSTWTAVTTSFNLTSAGDPGSYLQTSVQSSDGRVHFLADSNQGLQYARCTLTRDGSGHVTGATLDVKNVNINQGQSGGGGWGEPKGYIRVVTVGGTETIVIMSQSTVGTAHTIQICKSTSLTPTTSSDFTGITGSGSFTTLWSYAESGHERFAGFGQITSTGDLYAYHTYVPAENNWGDVVTIRMAASGTAWSAPAAEVTRRTTTHVRAVASSSSYVWFFNFVQGSGLRIDRINADGSYTQDAITAPTSTPGQAFMGASVSQDSTKIFAHWQVWNTPPESKFGYWNGSAWDYYSTTSTSADGDSWGSTSSTGLDNGLIVVNSDGTDNSVWVATIQAFTISTGANGDSVGTTTASGTLRSVGDASGSSTGTTTASGTLTSVGAASGASAGTTTSAGTLAGVGDASGSSTGTTTSSGAIAGVGTATGASTGTSTATGALLGVGSGSGASAGTTTASGAIAGVGPALGASTGATTATGLIVGVGTSSGSSAGTTTATGTLSQADATAYGASSGTTVATGSLAGVGDASGASAGSTTASATLLSVGPASGTSTGTTSASGTLSQAPTSASGASVGTTTAAGTLAAVGDASGASAGTTTASGTARGVGPASGASAGLSIAAGVLLAIGAASGASVGTSSASAQLVGVGQVSGASAGSTAASGTLTSAAAAGASGVSTGTTTASGVLQGVGAVVGASVGTTSTSWFVVIVPPLRPPLVIKMAPHNPITLKMPAPLKVKS